MDCSIHLPITSPELSTIHAARSPCSASRLLGNGRPCKVCGEESSDLLLSELDLLSVDKGDNAGIPNISLKETYSVSSSIGFSDTTSTLN